MKKLIAVVVAMMLALAFTACAQEMKKDEMPKDDMMKAEETEKDSMEKDAMAKPSRTVQQTQPSISSSTLISPEEESSPLSMLVSPYSFLSITMSCPVRRISSFMKVVLPAPRNPETMSIFILF